jgi:hypothetical protein
MANETNPSNFIVAVEYRSGAAQDKFFQTREGAIAHARRMFAQDTVCEVAITTTTGLPVEWTLAEPLAVEIETEDDGRILASIPSMPGVMAYGFTEAEARENVARVAEAVR